MKTLKKILTNFDAVITGTTLTICVVLANVNVVMRYFFKSPLPWGNEVITGLFVWTVFIGSAYAHRKHAHLGVDIVVNLMGGKARAVVQDIISILELVILIMLTVISAQYVYHLIYVRGVYKPTLTDVLRFPSCLIGAAVPVGFGLSTIYSIKFLLTERFHIIKKKNTDDDAGYQVEGGNF